MGLKELFTETIKPREQHLTVEGFNTPVSVGSLPIIEVESSLRFPGANKVILGLYDREQDTISVDGVPERWSGKSWFEVFLATETKIRQVSRFLEMMQISWANIDSYNHNHPTFLSSRPILTSDEIRDLWLETIQIYCLVGVRFPHDTTFGKPLTAVNEDDQETLFILQNNCLSYFSSEPPGIIRRFLS